MVTASLGTSNVRFPNPSFTYTKTLANLPPPAITVSAVFDPLQAGSWLMSIFAALGAVPSRLTVPLTLAAVAGSIGAAAGADVAAVPGAAGCSSLGFLLHAVSRTRPTTAHRPRVTNHCFRFIIALHLSWNWDEIFAIFYRAPPVRTGRLFTIEGRMPRALPPAGFVPGEVRLVLAWLRPMAPATRRCSSGVSWKI